MKTRHLRTRPKRSAIQRPPVANKPRFDPGKVSLSPPRSEQSLIQWPTEEQLQEVSRKLVRMNQLGVRWEANGDYFNSGDLAYQIQEIIRTTDDLFKRSLRLKR